MYDVKYENIESKLSEKYGVAVKMSFNSSKLYLRLADLEFGEGFSIVLKSEWRNISVEFVHDNFSAILLKSMETATNTKKYIFEKLSSIYLKKYKELKMIVNKKEVNPLVSEEWGDNWTYLRIKMTKFPIRNETGQDTEEIIIEILEDFLGLILTLLPVEETLVEDNPVTSMPEGALTKIVVNRYERSLINRQNCLLLKGYICNVCEFNFERNYGDLGAKFIHVHHIVPVSKLGANYEINPETDLVPLCPNCHAMIHKKNPPFSVEELKKILNENRTNE